MAIQKEMEQSNRIVQDDTTDEIKIRNAGLILIWPFLTRLFEQLEMVKNGAFINPSTKYRAIYLLQYLACSAIDYPEYELVLNKILVGMPIQDHLSPIEILSPEETNMATSLIKGLIQNWGKVQHSSMQGIQETFLQREGILSLNRTSNKLTISKKTVDILVAAIPWNLTLIKLPWMEKPLHVEWI